MQMTLLDTLVRLVVPVFELFRDFHVALLLATLLVVTGIAVLFWVAFGVARPFAGQIRRLTREIEASRRPADLTLNFVALDKRFTETKLLRHAWRRFREHLILPPPDRDAAIRYTEAPSRFFTIEAAESAGLSLRFYQSLPNYFVGIGLILTFLGLVAALYFASAAVASENVQQAQAALGDLLHAATFKFLTSIAGLFCSLLLSFSFRVLAQELSRELARLQGALEERMRGTSPMAVALEQHEEQRRQTELLQGMAPAIEESMTRSLPPMLAAALQPVTRAFGNLAGDFGDANLEAMGRMVGEFQTSLSRSAGKEVAALAETLAEIRNSLRSLNQVMLQSGADFGSRMDGAASKLESLTGTAGRALAEQFADMVAQLAAAGQPMLEMNERLSRAADAVAGAAGSLSKIQGQIDNAAGSLSEASSTLSKSWEDHRGRFEDIDRSLAASFGVLVQGADTHRRNIEDFVREMDSQFERALTAFASGIDELSGTVGELQRTMKSAGSSSAAAAD